MHLKEPKHISQKTRRASRGMRTILLVGISALLFLLAPASVYAGGGITFHTPNFSFSVHDDHYGKKHHRRIYRDGRRYHDRYRSHRNHRHYYQRHYYRDRYRNNHRYNHRHYYGNRWYNDPRSRDYWYRYNNRNNPYYNGYRRHQVCPTAGYSPHYVSGLDCYRHKGHFHCT